MPTLFLRTPDTDRGVRSWMSYRTPPDASFHLLNAPTAPYPDVGGQMNENERRSEIIRELHRVEESAKVSAANQFALSQQWGFINVALGVPASVLAAVAGVTVLSVTTGRFWAGIIALSASAFGAALTILNASKKATQATGAANAYLEIQTAARQERLIDSAARDVDDARQALAELTARRDEQNKSAAPPGTFARLRGKASLDRGGQSYAIDERGATDA